MSIDVQQVLGAPPRVQEAEWNEDEVILYHIGIGAGNRPVDPDELRYVVEGRLKVLPSFGVSFAVPMVLDGVMNTPGLNLKFNQVLHGAQEIEVLRPLPTAGAARLSGRFTKVFDKRSGAVLLHETVLADRGGEPWLVSRASTFARGEGEFGGDPGPKASMVVPARSPDLELERTTTQNQALLYRLTGDRNPLHADPMAARRAGFDRPILHGLCTYGIVAKAVVDEVLDGDVDRLRRYSARFMEPVFPGESLLIRMWHDEDETFVEVNVPERGARVLAGRIVSCGESNHRNRE